MRIKIRIKKLAAVNDPRYPTASHDQYIPGEMSVPIDYTVEGYIEGTLVEGQRLFIERTSRNGIPIRGYMATSPVVKLEGDKFHTFNSIYHWEAIPVDEA